MKPIKNQAGVFRYKYSKESKPEENWTVNILAFGNGDAENYISKRVGPISIVERGKLTDLHSITDNVLEMIITNFAISNPLKFKEILEKVESEETKKKRGPKPKIKENDENTNN